MKLADLLAADIRLEKNNSPVPNVFPSNTTSPAVTRRSPGPSKGSMGCSL